MNRLAFRCFVILALALSASAQQQRTLFLLGIITDAETRKPIAGVSVSSTLANTPAVTIADGTFRLALSDRVKPGDHVQIHLEKEGYRIDDLIEIASESNLYPIQLVPRSTTHKERPTKQPEQHEPQANLSAHARNPSLREVGLALASELRDFLRERQHTEPALAQQAGLAAPSLVLAPCKAEPQNDTLTPVYMQETRRVFADRFQARISEIHDELSRRGLQDLELEAIYKCVSAFQGNVDRLIELLGESIQKLAELLPPTDLYSGLDDKGFAEMAIMEADAIDDKVEAVMKDLQRSDTPNGVRSFFSYDFGQCCLNQVEYLRAELMQRLGPSAYDAREMESFMRLAGMKEEPLSSIQLVSDYAPLFRHLAVKMKRKAIPLSAPVPMKVSETDLGPGTMAILPSQRLPHRRQITIEMPMKCQLQHPRDTWLFCSHLVLAR